MELECLLPVIVYLKSRLSVKICKCRSRFDELMSTKSNLCFCRLSLLSPPGFPNVLQIKLDEWRHFGRLPICLFGFFRPRERQMPNLPWFLCLFKYLKGFKKNFPLPFHVSDLPHGSPVWEFNGGGSGDAYSPMKFIGGRENNG